MPSELNHIDDFFRDKNGELQADKSRMNADWQQMKQLIAGALIVPGKKPGKILSGRKYLPYAAGTILMITVTTLMILPGKKKGRSAATQITTNKTPVIKRSSSPTVLIATAAPAGKRTIAVKKTSGLLALNRRQTLLKKTIPLNLAEKKENEDIGVIAEKEKPAELSSKAAFENFYTRLEKQAQEFIINTKYDTTIRCNEGTSVFIPAGSFQTIAGLAIAGTVKIAVREFYSFADIIGNKLTTLSNGQPLVTGGMLNIQATANNEAIVIKPGANLNLKMPVRTFDPAMQLFIGQTTPGNSLQRKELTETTGTDTILQTPPNQADAVMDPGSTGTKDAVTFTRGSLNWIAAGQRQLFLNEKNKNITILNLMNNPYEVVTYRNGTKTLAKFKIPYNAFFDQEWMKYELEKRYGYYYDKIKVRREWTPLFSRSRIFGHDLPKDMAETNFVGDSITISLSLASRMKLITKKDSIGYEEKFRKAYEEAVKRDQSYSQFLQIKDNYDFRISNLGWINCDRFYQYRSSPLAEFTAIAGNGFEETYFQAMLILDKENAAMPGYWSNGKISFSRLPIGKQVNVVCVGAKDGKVYASIQKFTVQKNEPVALQFEETTPEQFRERLSRFGNVTGPD